MLCGTYRCTSSCHLRVEVVCFVYWLIPYSNNARIEWWNEALFDCRRCSLFLVQLSRSLTEWEISSIHLGCNTSLLEVLRKFLFISLKWNSLVGSYLPEFVLENMLRSSYAFMLQMNWYQKISSRYRISHYIQAERWYIIRETNAFRIANTKLSSRYSSRFRSFVAISPRETLGPAKPRANLNERDFRTTAPPPIPAMHWHLQWRGPSLFNALCHCFTTVNNSHCSSAQRWLLHSERLLSFHVHVYLLKALLFAVSMSMYRSCRLPRQTMSRNGIPFWARSRFGMLTEMAMRLL